MNWSVYIVAVLLASALGAGLGGLFQIGSVRAEILPSVVVFMALAAPKKLVLRAALFAGLVADLFAPVILADGTPLVVPGPRVLAFALGATAVIPLRGLLYRQNPLSNSAAVTIFSAFAALALIVVSILRSVVTGGSVPWWPATGTSEVVIQFLGALGDGVLALPVFWVLTRTKPIWGFATKTRLTPGVAREGL
jgi:hypothetical protein